MRLRAALHTLAAVLSVFALDEVQSSAMVTEMCPQNKELKIRRVQRLAVVSGLIKTLLSHSVFFLIVSPTSFFLSSCETSTSTSS